MAIGVVGPSDLVEEIMMIGADLPGAADWRLVGAPHAGEHETYEKFSRIADSIDVVLFTGPLQHDLARQAGELPVPATHVPMSGASLYASLLRGVLTQGIDPARVSIDSLPAADVDEAYGEIGVSTEGVHLSEYDQPESARGFAAFHEQLYRQGTTTAALTTIRSVAGKLAAEGVPVLRMLPTSHTLRLALNTAALLGTGSRLEESQIAIVVVELAASARPTYSGPGNYWQQELKLSLHQSLLADARLMGATVTARDENSYVVTATVGALAQATDGFRVAPFMDRIRADAGVAVEVGIGLGTTARDADSNAMVAVEKARGWARPPPTWWAATGWCCRCRCASAGGSRASPWSPPRRPNCSNGWSRRWVTGRSSWTPRRWPRCWRSRLAARAGCCRAWRRRGWPGRCPR
ncbi:GTP cyclohydrolase IIa [Nonomuraea recticatena]|uniref:GTP cyclohydrolase IIa n=1 Tax=Nonomuraea recticatena TaxID=46178 RepID=UPI00361D2464